MIVNLINPPYIVNINKNGCKYFYDAGKCVGSLTNNNHVIVFNDKEEPFANFDFLNNLITVEDAMQWVYFCRVNYLEESKQLHYGEGWDS